MSFRSVVIFICEEEDYDSAKEVNKALDERHPRFHFCPTDISGSELIGVGHFNYFNREDFISSIVAQEWKFPESVQALEKHEQAERFEVFLNGIVIKEVKK